MCRPRAANVRPRDARLLRADGVLPRWDAFVRRSRRLLDAHYELVETEHPGVQVWKRRSAMNSQRVERCATRAWSSRAPVGARHGASPLDRARRAAHARRARRSRALPRVRAAALGRRAPVPPRARARARGPRPRRRAEPHLRPRRRPASSTRSTSTSRGCGGSLGRGARMVHRVDGPIGVYRGFDDGTDAWIADVNAELAAATILQSQFSLEKHRELGLELRDPVVIPNAVDPAIFHPPAEPRAARGTEASGSSRRAGRTTRARAATRSPGSTATSTTRATS